MYSWRYDTEHDTEYDTDTDRSLLKYPCLNKQVFFLLCNSKYCRVQIENVSYWFPI